MREKPIPMLYAEKPMVADHFNRLAKIDDFIAKLWDIHIEVKKEGYAQVCCVTPYSLFSKSLVLICMLLETFLQAVDRISLWDYSVQIT